MAINLSIQMEPEDGHSNDPINHIPAMLDELEGKTTGEREPRRDRRRRRKQETRMQYYRQFKEDAGNKGKEGLTSQAVADNETDSDATFSNDPIVPRLSQEDVEDDVTEHTHQPSQITFIDNEVKEKNLDLSKADDEEELSEATCAPRPPDWVSPKAEKRKRKRLQQPVAEEVEIRSDIAFLTKTDIARNRLAIDEIKRVPKFENYTPGNPNKVCFFQFSKILSL